MTKMEEMIQNLKQKLNDSLKPESDSAEINRITELNKNLDDIQQEYTNLSKEYSEVKSTLIDYVKRGADTKTPPEDDTQVNTLPSFESYLIDKVKNKKEN